MEIEPIKNYKKLDDNTVEITTIVPQKITKIERDRAELQTELDHIPDRLAKAQEDLDAVNKRKDELMAILAVFSENR